MRNPAQNTERVDFRTTPDVKTLIEKAASIMGLDVSSYLRATVVPAAQQVVQSSETRLLTNRDRDLFLSLLDKPGQPTEALRAAAKRLGGAVKAGDVLL